MHIRFQRTELVNANPDRLWDIRPDYALYPKPTRSSQRIRALMNGVSAVRRSQYFIDGRNNQLRVLPCHVAAHVD